MGSVSGRRVRDVMAFELLCELWHACPDDQLRLQVRLLEYKALSY